MRLMRAGAALLLIGLGAAGCGIIPKVGEPLELYTLTPKTTFSEALPNAEWQLVVELPVSSAALDTPRIALQNSPFSVDYYAKAAWVDNAPAMVQTLLIESFESTKSIVAVGREAIGLRPDYVLKTDLREFQALYEQGEQSPPTILIRMNAKLVQMPERRITASQTFETRLTAASTKFDDVILAFDEALGKVFKEIVLFTLTSAAAAS